MKETCLSLRRRRGSSTGWAGLDKLDKRSWRGLQQCKSGPRPGPPGGNKEALRATLPGFLEELGPMGEQPRGGGRNLFRFWFLDGRRGGS